MGPKNRGERSRGEVDFSAETREKEAGHGDLEIEVSLLDIPEDFQKKLLKLKGVYIKQSERLVDDFRYTNPSYDFGEKSKGEKNLFQNQDVKSVLSVLGLKPKQGPDKTLKFAPLDTTIRLRKDGEKFFITIKGPPKQSDADEFKERKEREAEISEVEYNFFKEFIESKYNFKSRIQAKRTTLILPVSVYAKGIRQKGLNTVTVEVETFPSSKIVKPRAELEGDVKSITQARRFLAEQGIFTGDISKQGKTEILRQYLDQPAGEPLILKFDP